MLIAGPRYPPLHAVSRLVCTVGQRTLLRRWTSSQRLAAFSRRRSSWSASSGVSASPKSAASNTGRISISLGPGIGLGQRFTHATASAMSLTCHSQKPATSSRVSAKGPSMTVRLSPSKATRLPCDDGFRPSPASMTPALTSSSLNLPMASRSSVEGMTPASESFVAFTRTITRIVLSPLSHEGRLSRRLGRSRHADEAVAGDEFGQRLLAPPLRAGRPHGQHHVSHVGGAVVDPDLHIVRQDGPELGQHRAGLADGAAPVREALVPGRR